MTIRTLFPCTAALSLCAAALLTTPAPLLGQAPALTPQLSLADVQLIFQQAIARAAQKAPHSVIAIVDREGFVLGVWSVDGSSPTDDRIGAAVREAGTASFLSSDDNAFTSRTAEFIIQQNFPPGITNQPTGPLVGVEFSNLPFSDINRFKRLDPGTVPAPGQPINSTIRVPAIPAVPGDGYINGSLGTGIPNTRLSGRSGSAPLYKSNVLVGGIGVFTDPPGAVAGQPADTLALVLRTELPNVVPGQNIEESIAVAGQVGFTPAANIYGNLVTINGVGVPYVLAGGGRPLNLAPLGTIGSVVSGFSLHAAPPLFPFPVILLPGAPNAPVEVRYPICADPIPGTIEGQPRLSAAEVMSVMAGSAARAATTRAGIRLPPGKPMQIFITVVGNPNQAGQPAPVLGIVRTIGANGTKGATMFSFDVALQKARTALFFSSDQRAFSTRTVGFLAQNLYPPGIAGTHFGPFGPDVPAVDANGNLIISSVGLQPAYSDEPDPPAFSGLPIVSPIVTANVLATAPGMSPSPTGVAVIPPISPPAPAPAPLPFDPNLPNGITVFPGGFPLYRNGVLIGAIGVSGDGVDQDDLAAASGVGVSGFAPPDAIRADQMTYDGARLPFAKFPRNPDL